MKLKFLHWYSLRDGASDPKRVSLRMFFKQIMLYILFKRNVRLSMLKKKVGMSLGFVLTKTVSKRTFEA